MHNTEQTKGQSVLEHGIAVNNYYKDLHSHLKYDTPLKYEFKLPDWLFEYKEFILDNLYSNDILTEYQILHDIGKPYCLEIDEDAKNHFPNHASVSGKKYSEISNNKIVKELIENDMTFHLIKHKELDDLINNYSVKTIISLLITSLCEICSNATMFGGLNSISFRIKYKQINKRGKAILAKIKKK